MKTRTLSIQKQWPSDDVRGVTHRRQKERSRNINVSVSSIYLGKINKYISFLMLIFRQYMLFSRKMSPIIESISNRQKAVYEIENVIQELSLTGYQARDFTGSALRPSQSRSFPCRISVSREHRKMSRIPGTHFTELVHPRDPSKGRLNRK